MSVTTHHLTSNDVPLMEALLATFGEAFDDIATYTAHRPSEAYLRRLLSDAHVIFVQADTDVEDAPTIALYTKQGKREDVLHFDIAISGSKKSA